MKSTSKEDYLRAMFCLHERGTERIKSVDIAHYLGISRPAVSEMLRKMKEGGWLKMKPYSTVSLTKKGYREARKLTYKHRVVEIFLKEVLMLEKREIHKEAHKLEHVLSDKTIKKLSAFLDNPTKCPCGHNIPPLHE